MGYGGAISKQQACCTCASSAWRCCLLHLSHRAAYNSKCRAPLVLILLFIQYTYTTTCVDLCYSIQPIICKVRACIASNGFLPSQGFQPCIASATPACSCFAPSRALMPSLKSGISSALPSLRLHLTMPCSSTAKLPAVCHLFPLSVDRTLIPSSLSNLDTLGMLPSTCQKLDVPNPHDP
jgi:hypothetical protein